MPDLQTKTIKEMKELPKVAVGDAGSFNGLEFTVKGLKEDGRVNVVNEDVHFCAFRW